MTERRSPHWSFRRKGRFRTCSDRGLPEPDSHRRGAGACTPDRCPGMSNLCPQYKRTHCCQYSRLPGVVIVFITGGQSSDIFRIVAPQVLSRLCARLRQIRNVARSRIEHPKLIDDFEICPLRKLEKRVEIGVRRKRRAATVPCCCPHTQALNTDLLKESERLWISRWIEEVYAGREAARARHYAGDLKAQSSKIWRDRLVLRHFPKIAVH